MLQSMNFLMLQVLCGPEASFIQELLAYHWAYYFVYLTFVLVALLTLMNMLIGMLCDVVADAARSSKERSFLKEVKQQTERLARALDFNGDGLISKAEFDIIIKDPGMTATFASLGVDIVAAANFANFIYEQCDVMSYTDFGMLVGRFRGNKMATVKDVMDITHYITMELLELESRINQHANPSTLGAAGTSSDSFKPAVSQDASPAAQARDGTPSSIANTAIGLTSNFGKATASFGMKS